jgi:hypothetical protein
MRSLALFVSIFVALLVAIILPLVLSGKQAKADEEKARSRRLKDAEMNARLLRMNL